MHIILVSDRLATARSITLTWAYAILFVGAVEINEGNLVVKGDVNRIAPRLGGCAHSVTTCFAVFG